MAEKEKDELNALLKDRRAATDVGNRNIYVTCRLCKSSRAILNCMSCKMEMCAACSFAKHQGQYKIHLSHQIQPLFDSSSENPTHAPTVAPVIKIKDLGEDYVRLQWLRPVAIPKANIFHLQLRTGKHWKTVKNNIRKSRIVIDRLCRSDRYDFRVRAGNSVGWGPWSPEMSVPSLEKDASESPPPEKASSGTSFSTLAIGAGVGLLGLLSGIAGSFRNSGQQPKDEVLNAQESHEPVAEAKESQETEAEQVDCTSEKAVVMESEAFAEAKEKEEEEKEEPPPKEEETPLVSIVNMSYLDTVYIENVRNKRRFVLTAPSAPMLPG